MEAKANRSHSIQKAEVACSKAIHKAVAWKTSQAVMFHEEHGKYIQGLEEQAFGEESRSHHNVLSSCQAILSHSPQLLRGALAALFHLLLGQAPPLPPPFLPPRTCPVEEQPSTATPPTPMPKQSPRLKRQHPLPEPMGNMPMGGPPWQPHWEDLPAPRSERPLPGSSRLSPAMLRPSSGTIA